MLSLPAFLSSSITTRGYDCKFCFLIIYFPFVAFCRKHLNIYWYYQILETFGSCKSQGPFLRSMAKCNKMECPFGLLPSNYPVTFTQEHVLWSSFCRYGIYLVFDPGKLSCTVWSNWITERKYHVVFCMYKMYTVFHDILAPSIGFFYCWLQCSYEKISPKRKKKRRKQG